jgi:hypothetical protein
MALGLLTGGMTPEFGNALIAVDATAFVMLFAMIFSARIAAWSKRAFKWINPALLATRFRLWRSAHSGH